MGGDELMAASPNNRRTALITGAAGQLGHKVAEHLSSQGKNIIGLYRNKLPASHKNLLPLWCDLQATETIVAPLKSTDTVIHLAWSGGVLGSTKLAPYQRDHDVTDEKIQASPNVTTTRNLIKAMERANSQKIIFVSWVGVDKRATSVLLREKYWAENLVINSSIPTKIIIRAGIIGAGLSGSDFLRAASSVGKIPLFLPVPRNIDGVVITTLPDFIWAIEEALKVQEGAPQSCRIIDLTSTSPSSGASIVAALDLKSRGKRSLKIGGVVGDMLFRWTEKKFGTTNPSDSKLTDYLDASKVSVTVPADGLPCIVTARDAGNKIEVGSAL
jgi:nucleoside-diphosphate-sugar epimerase